MRAYVIECERAMWICWLMAKRVYCRERREWERKNVRSEHTSNTENWFHVLKRVKDDDFLCRMSWQRQRSKSLTFSLCFRAWNWWDNPNIIETVTDVLCQERKRTIPNYETTHDAERKAGRGRVFSRQSCCRCFVQTLMIRHDNIVLGEIQFSS